MVTRLYLSSISLMRLALLRLGEENYYFIWSSHHVLLDGWCRQLLIKEVFACYEAYCQGREIELSRPQPYRDYIEWLRQQDLEQAEAFWESLQTPHTP